MPKILSPKALRKRLRATGSHLGIILGMSKRRREWFLDNLTLRKVLNALVAMSQFALKSERMRAWPVIVKVDISPVCNLKCTVCVHALPSATSNQELKGQEFNGRQMMRVEQFQRIVDEISGRSMAISMYYLGDPLVHPDLDEMCGRAWKGGLNTHVSTNFSFKLSDERIRGIVESGLTHLTVCVDGLRQETYELTRVGGKIDLVLNNLERLLNVRKGLGRVYPKVEVQYIMFQHNVADVEEARRKLTAMGVDQFTTYWGQLNNYTDFVPGKFPVYGPKENRPLPQCHWPHFSLQIKYDGDVIPCCNFRQGTQYTDSDDKRIIGNVFQSSLWNVWNSHAYQEIRRFVSDPERVKSETGLKETFCDSCPALFVTEIGSTDRLGNEYKWEDLYERDARGRVVRKPETEIHRDQPRPEPELVLIGSAPAAIGRNAQS